MTYIPESLRILVRERAISRCEYCRLNQVYSVKRHHFDHIYAEKHGGETLEENLCLACLECNSYKGSDLASLDPLTREPVFLFHPRRDIWEDHFRLEYAYIVGISPQGRATARLLKFNDVERVKERMRLINLGLYPG